jgi:hypothetical protein
MEREPGGVTAIRHQAWRRASRHKWGVHGERGQGIVEFTLVSLLLMTIIFGTIDLGRGVVLRAMLTNAVREAARDGSIYPDGGTGYPALEGSGGMVEAAQRRSPILTLTAANFEVQCSRVNATGTFDKEFCAGASDTVIGGLIEVCGAYQYRPAAASLLRIPPVTMRECARMAIH